MWLQLLTLRLCLDWGWECGALGRKDCLLYVEQMLLSIDFIHHHLKISWVKGRPEEQRNNPVKEGVRPAVDVLMRKKEVKLAQSKTSTVLDCVLYTASIFMMTSYKGSAISIL